MKPFKSSMAAKLEEYMAYRQTLGYVIKPLRPLLRRLDEYTQEKNPDGYSLEPSFFLGFRQKLKGRDPRTANAILSAARGFFQFLVRQGRYRENPLQDIPSFKEMAYIPFIFSPEDIQQLLLAVQKRIRNDSKYFFLDLTVHLAILLMVHCGLRISEPLRLLQSHYRREEATIYIEKTKFHKDRLIPIPKAVAAEIENYLTVRKALLPKDCNPYLLAGKNQNGILINNVYPAFHQMVKDMALDQPKKIVGNTTFGQPRPHSLRHSFAVNTLKQIKERGESPQDALPVLAAYMGHTKYRYTAVYLKVLDAEHRQGLVDFAISQQEEL